MRKITPPSFLIFLSLILISVFSIQAKTTNPTFVSNYTYNLLDFKVSPNPAKNIIRVDFNTNITSDLFIHDGLGNEVLSKRINNESSKEISLDNINSGIYFISVKIESKTIIKRLIKY